MDPKLSEDFNSLLTNPSPFSDVILKCGKSHIPAHKCILTARSRVFAAMFQNEDMQENRSGTVDVVDIQEDVLKAMLKYIYGGKVDDQLLSGDLMFAADKYELEGLKQTCIDSLKNTLSMDNVLHVLILGYLHDKRLKEYTVEFICKQNLFLKLEGTKEWELLKKNYPVLAMELVTSVVKYQDGLLSSKSSANKHQPEQCGLVDLDNMLPFVRNDSHPQSLAFSFPKARRLLSQQQKDYYLK